MIYQIIIFLLLSQLILGIKNIKYAIIFLIIITFLIPNTLKFNLGGINLNVFNLSTTILALCSWKYIRKKNLLYLSLKKQILFIVLYILIISFFNTIGEYGIGFWIKSSILYFMEFYLVSYCFLYIKLDSKKIYWINISIAIVTAIVSLYAIINYITKINPYIAYVSLLTDTLDASEAFINEERGALMGRVTGTFTHPLILGQMMLLAFSYLIFQLKQWKNKLIYLIICILTICPIMLCGSRSALFPLLLIPLFNIFYLGTKKFIKYIFIVILILPLCISILPKEYQSTAEAMIYVWDSSKSEKAEIKGSNKDMRINQINDALKIIENDLIFGKGNGYIKEYGSNHPEMLGYEGLILYTLVDLGILGTILFLMFYIFLYKYILFKAKKNIEKVQATSLCGCYFICILLTGISYSTFSFFFLLYFLTLNTFRINSENKIKSQPPNNSNIICQRTALELLS